jgi:hypothetical protein
MEKMWKLNERKKRGWQWHSVEGIESFFFSSLFSPFSVTMTTDISSLSLLDEFIKINENTKIN